MITKELRTQLFRIDEVQFLYLTENGRTTTDS